MKWLIKTTELRNNSTIRFIIFHLFKISSMKNNNIRKQNFVQNKEFLKIISIYSCTKNYLIFIQNIFLIIINVNI